MLATLAASCRPHGATRWDEAGIVAALAKVRHLSLTDVILATIRAADDRELKTPGAIANPASSCWKERGTDRPASRREWPDDAHRCRTCSMPPVDCRRIWADDHPFEPADQEPAADVPRIIEALRGAKADTPPTQPKPETTTDGTERVAPVRAALAEKREETDA